MRSKLRSPREELTGRQPTDGRGKGVLGDEIIQHVGDFRDGEVCGPLFRFAGPAHAPPEDVIHGVIGDVPRERAFRPVDYEAPALQEGAQFFVAPPLPLSDDDGSAVFDLEFQGVDFFDVA